MMSEPASASFRHAAAPKPLLPLHIGDTYVPPPDGAQLKDIAAHECSALYRYAHPAGLPELREAIAARLAARGFAADPADVPAAVTRGQAIYAEQCVACHGAAGEGNRELGAPRLSDQVWLYGGTKQDIVAMIRNPRMGVMPAWHGRLDPATINMLTVFVHALGGGE